tara:strand:- start:741 stop:1040 length:300 start_codon:yes stop_codon:yes gene_type:complete
MVDSETSQLSVVVETHIFTTMRYKNEVDNGFSGNLSLLIEAVQHSEKVLDEDLKLLAKGILTSVIKHKIIKHSEEEILKAIKERKEATSTKEEEKELIE